MADAGGDCAQKRRWVFQELVESDSDFVGLIAYGLYKTRKNELAQAYRDEGMPEADIDRQLSSFHDQEVTGIGSLNKWRELATQLLNDLLVTHESGVVKGKHPGNTH